MKIARVLIVVLAAVLPVLGVMGMLRPAEAAREARPMAGLRDVVINEIGWGGTAASSADEWIELKNNTAAPVSLAGWSLRADDGAPNIALTGTIPADGYFLLERTDDNTLSDIPADQLYTGDLGNGGEVLRLTDDLSNTIDTANGDGGVWPAGSGASGYYSMERIDPTSADVDANWAGNDGLTRNGLDANSNPINGTPGQPNSALGV